MPRIEQGKMQPAGLKAYEARRENISSIYSYEQRSLELEAPYHQLLKKIKAAWRFFQAQPDSYRRVVSWWIISAKKKETRLKRLEELTAFSAQGQRLPGLTSRKSARKTSLDPAKQIR
jgi:uncharacterized protein YdeI (YjbR/CyaY-like superfamily)